MKTIEITNKTGIHARPASLIVKEAGKYKANITFSKEGKEVSAKSIIGILSLGLAQGDEIGINAEGEDAEKAVNGLYEIIKGLNEE